MADVSLVRQLEAKGFNPDQAEAIASTVRTGVADGVATKTDIAELKIEFAELKTDLLRMKRIGVVIVALLVVPFLRDLLAVLN